MNSFKILAVMLILLVGGGAAMAQKSKKKKKKSKKGKTEMPVMPKKVMENDIDSFSYAYGSLVGKNLGDLDLKINPEAFIKGIEDCIADSAKFDPEEANKFVSERFRAASEAKRKAELEKNRLEGEAFLEENKSKEGVVVLESGLQYMVMKEGTGPKPSANDKVTTHYHGTLVNGTVFDSSVDRGQPATFPVNGVIPGWVEALQLMNVGSKWKLFIPANLAYGERQTGSIGPNSTLIFEVELLGIDK